MSNFLTEFLDKVKAVKWTWMITTLAKDVDEVAKFADTLIEDSPVKTTAMLSIDKALKLLIEATDAITAATTTPVVSNEQS